MRFYVESNDRSLSICDSRQEGNTVYQKMFIEFADKKNVALAQEIADYLNENYQRAVNTPTIKNPVDKSENKID